MKSIYPVKTMNITQGYSGSLSSHKANVNGRPSDLPWDEAGEDTGRDWFIPSCDFIIRRIYGVGSKGDNTIWLESVAPVEMPVGIDYLALMIIHPEDAELKKYKVGSVIKKGSQPFREGQDGHAYGNHFHLAAARGKIKGNGWVQNSKGAYVLTATGANLRPEEAFFIDESTRIKSSCGYKFQREDNEVIENIKSKWFGKEVTEKGIFKDGSNYLSPKAASQIGLKVSSKGAVPIIDMGKLKINIDGKALEVDGFNPNGTSYMEIRKVVEAMGATIGYEKGITTIETKK